MSSLKRWLTERGWWLPLLTFFAVYLLPLNQRGLWIPDEARYAEISREMIQSGNWIVPKLLGLRYFEKPIVGYWLNNISQILFGQSHFAVRFASALSAGLSGLLVFWLASQLFQSRKKAVTAALCYFSFLEVYAVGTYSALDSMVTLWLNLVFFVFYFSLQERSAGRKNLAYGLLGVVAGLGFLTKGFLAFAVPFVVILPYLAHTRRLGELRYLGAVLVGTLLISLPWAIAIHLREPDYWHYFFWVEHIQRFFAADAQHKEPFWFYLPVLVFGSLPWLGVLPAALKKSWESVPHRPAILFLLYWLVGPFIFFSIAKGKLLTYILPCFAPLAILLGHGVIELIEQRQWRSLRLNGWLNLAVGSLFSLGFFLLGTGKLGKQPLYLATETCALALVVLGFVVWALLGWVSAKRPERAWWATSLCPAVFGLVIGSAMPASYFYSKMPENFVAEHQQVLNASRFVLSNDVGLAVDAAWVLKREDIRLYAVQGELAYGLTTSSVADKYVPAENFPAWLQQARTMGNVALLVKGDAQPFSQLPTANEVLSQNHLTLFLYRQQAHD